MEDKSLERGVEKLAESILSEIETGPDGSYNHTKMLKVAEEVLKLYAKQENASLQDKLRVVEAENERLKDFLKTETAMVAFELDLKLKAQAENATLQSQITALQEQNMKLSMPSGGAVDEFIQYHHNPIVGQKNTEIATLQSQITALKEENERLMSNIHLSLDVNKEKSLEIVDLQAKLSVCKEAMEGIVSYHPTHAADDDDRHCCRSFNKAEQALTQLQLGRDGV